MKSTLVKPSNGQAKKKPSSQRRSKGSSFSLRRLTKRQLRRIGRIAVWAFLIAFVLSLLGGVMMFTSMKPAGT